MSYNPGPSYTKLDDSSFQDETDNIERLHDTSSSSYTANGGQNAFRTSRFPYIRNNLSYIAASFFVLVTILSFSLYILNDFVHRPHDVNKAQKTRPSRVCGNNATEAKALGCTLDKMSWSWLSPTCPRYASDEFEQVEEFRYFSDPVNRVVVTDEDWEKAINNELPLYTERREHVTHCVYTFLSLAQIIRDGTKTHPKLDNYGHIKHCVGVLMESLRRDKDWETIDADMGEVSFDEGC